MTPRSSLSLRIGAALLVLGSAGLGLAWFRRASDPARQPGAATTAADQTILAADLAALLALPDDTRGLHLLANWIDAHDLPAIRAALAGLPGLPEEKHRALIWWLLSAKLAELHPGETIEQNRTRVGELMPDDTSDFAHDETSEPRSLREQMVELARTDATAALARLGAMRLHPNDRESLVCAVLSEVAGSDPQRALRLLEQRIDVSHADAHRAIGEAWAEKNPAEAFAWARSLPASSFHQRLAGEILNSWASTDLSGAVEAALSAEPAFEMEHLLSRWLKESPAESAAWLSGQERPSPVLVQAAVDALARTHPRLAADLLARHLPLSQQPRQAAELASGWMESDPAGCHAWLRARPVDSLYFAAAESIAEHLGDKNPAGLPSFVASLPTGVYLGDIIRRAANTMDSPQAALEWVLSFPPEQVQSGTISNIVQRMDFARPQDALALLSRMPDTRGRDAVHASVAARWFQQDPKGAVAWISSLHDPATLLAAIRGAGSSWSEKDPEGAAAFAAKLGSGPAFDALLSQAAHALTARDAADAAAWLVTLPDSPASRKAASQTFTELALHQPDEAARLIAALPVADSRHEAALSASLRALGPTQPEDSARLLTTLGTPAEQEKWAHRVAYDWSAGNLEAATRWATGLAHPAARDHALGGLVTAAVREDPRRALALANQATDPGRRANIVSRTITEWHRRDPAAALAALETTDLPPERKERLARSLAK